MELIASSLRWRNSLRLLIQPQRPTKAKEPRWQMGLHSLGMHQCGSDQAESVWMNCGMIHAVTSSARTPPYLCDIAVMNVNGGRIAHLTQNSVISRLNQNKRRLRISKPHETLIKSRNGPWLTCGDGFALGACRLSPVICRNAYLPQPVNFGWGLSFDSQLLLATILFAPVPEPLFTLEKTFPVPRLPVTMK